MENKSWWEYLTGCFGKGLHSATVMGGLALPFIPATATPAHAQERTEEKISINLNRRDRKLHVGSNSDLSKFILMVKVPDGTDLETILMRTPGGERDSVVKPLDEGLEELLIRNEVYTVMQQMNNIGGGFSFLDPMYRYIKAGRKVMTAKGTFAWVFLRPGEMVYSMISGNVLKDASKAVALSVIKDIIDHPQVACLDIAKKFYEECIVRFNMNRKMGKYIHEFGDLTITEARIYSDNVDFINTYLVAANALSNNILRRKSVSETIRERIEKRYRQLTGNEKKKKSDLQIIFEEASMALEEYGPYKIFVNEVRANQREIDERKARFAEFLDRSRGDIYGLSVNPGQRWIDAQLPDDALEILAYAKRGIWQRAEILRVSSGVKPEPRLRPRPEVDEGTPTISRSSSKIAFASKRDGNLEIYVMRPDGSNQRRLTNNSHRDWDPQWSPDRTRIAFSSIRAGNVEIYVMNADGSNQRRLTSNSARDLYPKWSPDGTRITFSSARDGNDKTPGIDEIYVMDADGSNQRRLTNNSNTDAKPSWSPDGKKIVFERLHSIYIMNADGSNQRRLTNNYESDLKNNYESNHNPCWSPDGTKIAYESNSVGNTQIYVMDADGSNQRKLTPAFETDASPQWSPDGTRIAFHSKRDGNYEIYVMDADGSDQRKLTDSSGANEGPRWSLDGRKIFFTKSSRGYRKPEVYVVNADGSGFVKLANGTLRQLGY